MNGGEILGRLVDIIYERQWHWYCWHASEYGRGRLTPFFLELMTALSLIDQRMPGSASEIVERIGSLGGDNRNQGQYDQLYQILAEVQVLRQVCAFDWGDDAVFEYEASIAPHRRSPELIIACGGRTLAVEVKAPVIRDYRNEMGEGWQATARGFDPKVHDIVTLPRDNPIKDALESADRKFSTVRQEHPNVAGILVVIWDHLMNEPIAALLNPASGLFTANTFDREKRTFAEVDAVVILPHAHQLVEGPGNRYFTDGDSTFCWPEYPIKPYILNPNSGRDPVSVLEGVFGAQDQRNLIGPEYNASDVVLWIRSARSRGPT